MGCTKRRCKEVVEAKGVEVEREGRLKTFEVRRKPLQPHYASLIDIPGLCLISAVQCTVCNAVHCTVQCSVVLTVQTHGQFL